MIPTDVLFVFAAVVFVLFVFFLALFILALLRDTVNLLLDKIDNP